MAVKIYDSSLGAWKDAATPKIYKDGAWQDAVGRIYKDGAWQDAWTNNPLSFDFETSDNGFVKTTDTSSGSYFSWGGAGYGLKAYGPSGDTSGYTGRWRKDFGKTQTIDLCKNPFVFKLQYKTSYSKVSPSDSCTNRAYPVFEFYKSNKIVLKFGVFYASSSNIRFFYYPNGVNIGNSYFAYSAILGAGRTNTSTISLQGTSSTSVQLSVVQSNGANWTLGPTTVTSTRVEYDRLDFTWQGLTNSSSYGIYLGLLSIS